MNANRRTPKRGFTLLELLLAAAISAMLMASVSTVLIRQYRLALQGQDLAEEARALLAISRRIQDDLASFDFDQRNLLDPLPDLAGSSVRERFLDWEAEFSLDPVTLVGDEQSLFLSRLRPTKEMVKRERSIPMQHEYCVWTSTHPRELRLPYRVQDTSAEIRLPSWPDPISGLGPTARCEVVLHEKPVIQRVSYYPSFLEELSFRYFDGQVWAERWNSVSRRALPQAVEVRVRVAGAQNCNRILVSIGGR